MLFAHLSPDNAETVKPVAATVGAACLRHLSASATEAKAVV